PTVDTRLCVAHACAVCVFENEHFVVGLFAGDELWVGLRADDPEPAARVPADLDRFDDTVFFGSEEVRLKAGREFEGGEFGGGVVLVGFSEGERAESGKTSNTQHPTSNI